MVRIKQLRTERNLTQRAVAEIIQSSQKAVDVWERGISEPTSHFVIALADCFGCSADYLLGRTDERGGFFALSEREKILLEHYRAADEKGQKKLLETAEECRNGF